VAEERLEDCEWLPGEEQEGCVPVAASVQEGQCEVGESVCPSLLAPTMPGLLGVLVCILLEEGKELEISLS